MHLSRLVSLFSLVISLAAGQSAPRLQEPWETGYSKDDAIGAAVLGYWKFDGGDALKDSSGKGNDLTLHGAVPIAKGKWGGGLESFAGYPVQDKDHSAHTMAKPRLSPRGAFTIEMWIKAKAEFEPTLRAFLLDQKDVDHADYQWTLGEADKAGQRCMAVNLGFGTESQLFHSAPMKLGVGEWHHVAFTYDGAGEVRFFADGQALGVAKHAGCGPVVPGTKALSLGDRLGSN